MSRYESPPLDLADVQGFVDEFGDLLANDARHEFWIGSTTNAGMLVYDDHGIIYAYGPLEEFEQALSLRGITSGAFDIPAPHTHHYHAEYDKKCEQLLSRLEWTRTELHSDDPQ